MFYQEDTLLSNRLMTKSDKNIGGLPLAEMYAHGAENAKRVNDEKQHTTDRNYPRATYPLSARSNEYRLTW